MSTYKREDFFTTTRDGKKLRVRVVDSGEVNPSPPDGTSNVMFDQLKGELAERWEMSPDARSEIDEDLMKEVEKKYPHTKWSDLAAYNLLDNKICGQWKGETKCPEKESEMYERYAREHPQSPKAAEALYNAAWRQAALVDMYKEQHQADKAEKAKRKRPHSVFRGI